MTDVKQELIDTLEAKFQCQDITPMVEFLFESGMADPKRLKYYFLKKEYYQRLKDRADDESCNSIKMDLANDFDCSYPQVKNIIYKYKYLQP